jgi:group I intron endonuclease
MLTSGYTIKKENHFEMKTINQKSGIIYIIINLINGKQNIGQTTRSLKKRIGEHKKDGYLLSKAIRKYGIENFKVISFSCPEEDLDWTETFLIKELKTQVPNGYNLQPGGSKYKHHHKITKRKMKKYWANPKIKKEKSRKSKKQFETTEARTVLSNRRKKYIKENPDKIIKSLEKNKKTWSNPKKRKEQSKLIKKYYKTHPEKKEEISKKISGEKNSQTRNVLLISPKGIKYNLLSYRSFCKKHHLTPTLICQVLQNKQKHHKGWTGKYLEEKNVNTK